MTIAEILEYLPQPSGHQSDRDGLERVLRPGLPDPSPCSLPHGTSPSITGLAVGPYLQCTLPPLSLWLCHCFPQMPSPGPCVVQLPGCLQAPSSHELRSSPTSSLTFFHSCPEFVFLFFFSCILTIRQVPQDEQLCLPSSVPGACSLGEPGSQWSSTL